ncbi:DUF3772 domain-containing protein, partial [Rhodobacteraceae bacterium]|nr:DUF3772 domain-containing protein [Paracoccaceae bacterium]
MIRPLRQTLLWLGLVLFYSLSAAQAQDQLDYGQFDTFANSVSSSLENDQLPDYGFETLRSVMVNWRDDFLDARAINIIQIDSLNAQIDSLGPLAAEGETEPAALARRREALNESLQEALAPRIRAEESFARANALISQIDARLRARQTDALFELSRTPLDPTLWPGAVTALIDINTKIRDEAVENLQASSAETSIWQRVAIAVLLVIVAVLLVVWGPRVIERQLTRIETSAPGDNGRVLLGFLLSFGNVLVSVLAVSLLNLVLISSGILGETGRALAIGINAAILCYAVARWLAGRLFPKRASIPTILVLSDAKRARARYVFSAMGTLAGLLMLVGFTEEVAGFDTDVVGVITLPIFVVLAIVLFKVGGFINQGGSPAEGATPAFSDRVERLMGRALQLAAIIGLVSAVVGLQHLARGVLLPSAFSIGLVAFLSGMHFAFQAFYAIVRRLNAEQSRQALAPVLFSLFLTVVSIPVFALIWGARDSDLGEIWTGFKTGIPLGDSSISPVDLLTFAAVFAAGFGLTRLLQGTLKSSVLPRTKMDVGGRNAIVSGLGYLGVTIAALVAVTTAGINLSSFAIIIGALSVGIGFGLQNIVNNFVSGIILLIERPIGEGDWVEVNGQMGVVQAISVRSTRIETFDRTDVIVPNGDLISGTVTNWTRGNSVGRIIVPVGVAYGTDTRKVETILREIAEAHPIVTLNPAPKITFKGFGADSMDFEIRAILSDIYFGLDVRSDINHEIARRFAEEDIEIPFAQRDV